MKNTSLNTEEEVQGESESYWISIGDLMSGLMFIFILALSVFLMNITDLTESQFEKEKLRQALLQEINIKMEAEGFTDIIVDEQQGILRLEQGILFDSGEANLLPQGENLLSSLAPIINTVLRKDEYKGEVETIFIEGHTDNEPVSYFNSFDSNWDLSTQRAINTWLFMSDVEASLNTLENNDEVPIFSVSGYADSRPIDTNETEEGRKANRRIDFRFNMVPPDIESESEEQVSNTSKSEIEDKINR